MDGLLPPRKPVGQQAESSLPRGVSLREFVPMMAAIMSVPALSTDPMLPALPQIGADLGVAAANDRQHVITLFFVGIAAGALLFGPLSDRFGRRPVILWASVAMFAASVLCAVAPTFEVLMFARLTAGFFAAAGRVTVVSIVRDGFRGDAMARIMSLIMMIFIIVPILAPSFGQVVLAFMPWRGIFWTLAAVIAAVLAWTYFRLPETLHPEHRVGIGLADVLHTLGVIFGNRSSIGYMLASGVLMGAFIGFLVSSQQIFFDVFHVPDLFPLAFAGIAIWLGIGSFFNSRLVERFGARRLSQTAVIILILVSLMHAFVVLRGEETIVSFMISQSVLALCFSFAAANFSSISLEPFARGAGFASSVQTTLTTLISVGLGAIVGSRFDGTTLPVTAGFCAYGIAALLLILWAERGRLFTRPNRGGLRKEAKTAMPGS